MKLTRREWHQVAFGGFFAASFRPTHPTHTTHDAQTHRGVTLGVQSYSFRDRPLAAAIDGMTAIGLKSCELWQGHVEPPKQPRADLRRWRETVSLDEFHRIREMFTKAGITISAYNISFRDDFSDAEIDRGFDMTKALGANVITASSTVTTIARVAPAAARHKIPVGMHNHSRIDPNEFATPESLIETEKGPGGFVRINLDIGHFTAANFDAADFLRTHHARIVSLHLKDRKRDQGANLPFGEGDTPIAAVLRLLRDQKWTIPANIEYEYKGGDTVEEVRRCFEFCRRTLDS